MTLIPKQEAEKAAKEYADKAYNPNGFDSLSYPQAAMYSKRHDDFQSGIEYSNAKFSEVVPVLEKCRSLFEMLHFRSIKDSQPKNRSLVLGADNVGYFVYEFKHGCFFNGLERNDNVHSWMPLTDVITSDLVKSALSDLNELLKTEE